MMSLHDLTSQNDCWSWAEGCAEGAEEEDQRAKEELQEEDGGVWKSLTTIFWQRKPHSQAAGDQTRMNDMNLFFNRFDQTPTPPPHLCFPPPPLPKSPICPSQFSRWEIIWGRWGWRRLWVLTGSAPGSSSAPCILQISTTNHPTVLYKSSLTTLLLSASLGMGMTEPTENLLRTLWTGASGTISSSMLGRLKGWWWISTGTNNPAHR